MNISIKVKRVQLEISLFFKMLSIEIFFSPLPTQFGISWTVMSPIQMLQRILVNRELWNIILFLKIKLKMFLEEHCTIVLKYN